MAEPTRGLLDTSVVIDHDHIDPDALPDESAISAITLAELAVGPHATDDLDERARRQDRLQWAATTFDGIAFDAAAARAYGRAVGALRSAGRRERGRIADVLIAATAMAHELPLYTRNPHDLTALEGLIDVRRV